MIENNLFDGLDPKVVEFLSEHPEVLNDKHKARFSANAAYTTTEVSGLCNRTPVQEPLSLQIVLALNLALLSERLETEFYARGLNTPDLIPNELRQNFVRIWLNEVAQREILIQILGQSRLSQTSF